MSDFDPYYKWLAIPPAEQPPNHYRLLGLVMFEADVDVISAAADRQMAHVRSYQHGPQSERSQQLLNEISQARLTLLRPDTKSQYDAQLRAKQAPLQATASSPSVPLPAPLAKPAPKPLKVAAPLQTATMLPQPLPHPQPQPHPQPLPHPNPSPQPAARPAPAPAPRPMLTVNAGNAAAVVTDKPATEEDDSAEKRRRKKQKSTIGAIVGVVVGGLMGTYIAGIVLNFLGAPLPDGVRFLPGLRAGKEIVDKPTENRNNNVNNSSGKGNNQGNNNNSGNANNGGQVGSGRIPPGADLWSLAPAVNMRYVFAPGRHTYAYHEDGRPFFKHANLPLGSGSLATSKVPLGDALLHSPAIRSGYVDDLKSHYLFAAPNSTGQIAIPIRLAANTQITSRNCFVSCMVTPGESSPARPVELVLARSIQPGSISYGPSDIISTQILNPGGNNCLVPLPEGLREFYLVFVLKNDPAPNNGEGMRLYLRPDELKITFQLEAASGTIASNNNNSANTSNTGIPKVQLETPDPSKRQPPPATDVPTQEQRLQSRNQADPKYWIQAAEGEQNTLTKYAMLNLAIKRAVDAGDVQQFAYAYERLDATFSQADVSGQVSYLNQLASGQRPGFQPAAYANFSLSVLKKLKSQGELSQHVGLLTNALRSARDAGDAEALRELTLLAVEVSR